MRFALTTFDNPYDPFEQFTQWFMFDEEKGYHTTAYLGRIARTSDQLSDEENDNLNVSNEFSIVADPFAYGWWWLWFESQRIVYGRS